VTGRAPTAAAAAAEGVVDVAAVVAGIQHGLLPPDTPVLAARPLRPGVDPTGLSVVADQRWLLSPAIFEDHLQTRILNYALQPQRFWASAKRYVWLLLNHAEPPRPPGSTGRRLSVASIGKGFDDLAAFLHWLDTHQIACLADVTAGDLDAYLRDLLASQLPRAVMADRVIEVRRLWAWRKVLPACDRLPEAPPWNGDNANTIVGHHPHGVENRTPRIHPDTMDRLLGWALRFVDAFADDILAAAHEHRRLHQHSLRRRRRDAGPTRGRRRGELERELRALLERLGASGEPLPGIVGADGRRAVAWEHLGRLLGCVGHGLKQRFSELVEAAGLPVADAAYLDPLITGRVDDKPWRRQRIAYHEAEQLAQHLIHRLLCRDRLPVGHAAGGGAHAPARLCRLRPGHTAVAAARPSVEGRPGRDGRQTARGRRTRRPLGGHRAGRPCRGRAGTPARPGAAVSRRAVPRVKGRPPLERPAGHGPHRPGRRRGHRAVRGVGQRLLPGQPAPPRADPPRPQWAAAGAVAAAPHAGVVHRAPPAGLVAGAIQYGHVQVQVTLGYSGTYASGFPDEHAFETWLLRLEQLADAQQALGAGEHVSGPAAGLYRERTLHANRQFAGRALTSTRQARDLLANPALQLYPAKAMTCVFDPAKAKCRLQPSGDDARRTPNLSDCQPGCQNIARTDQDIVELRRQAAALAVLVDDPLSPAPRRQRECHALQRLTGIIDEHERTRPGVQPASGSGADGQ
jgi:hypothetical protein